METPTDETAAYYHTGCHIMNAVLRNDWPKVITLFRMLETPQLQNKYIFYVVSCCPKHSISELFEIDMVREICVRGSEALDFFIDLERYDLADILIKHGLDINDLLHDSRITPKIAKYLISKGADVNRPRDPLKKQLWPPLMNQLNTMTPSLEVIEILIKAGANVNYSSSLNQTPLSMLNDLRLKLGAAMLLFRYGAWDDWMKRNYKDYRLLMTRIELLMCLCSVRIVPRIGWKSPLRVLPVEMIRLVESTLDVPVWHRIYFL